MAALSDPIADMLVRIQNAYRARLPSLALPYSQAKERVAAVLAERGFIADAEKKGRRVRKVLEITLRYEGDRPAMRGFRRVSKPSRRLYLGVSGIRPVRQGFGLLVISTPQGVKSGEQAVQARVGGEPICEVW